MFPSFETRYCARYVYANFRKQYSTEILRECFWKTTRATSKIDFDNSMTTIKLMKTIRSGWLTMIQAHGCAIISTHFTRLHVVNNTSESWNGYLNEYRRKPIFELLHFSRMRLMNRLIRRREKYEDWESDITLRVKKKIY